MAWYYGSDSGTPTGNYGSTFYIGRLGQGDSTQPDTLWAIPRPSARRAATYWNIVGPSGAPVTTPTLWGEYQATAYWSSYAAYGIPSGTPLNNLFGSITTTVSGWTIGNYGPNQGVVNGFLNKLSSLSSGAGFHIGLYGSQVGAFEDRLDSATWTSPVPIVVWIASYVSAIPAQTQLEADYCPMPTVGGYFPMIWQYYGNPDYDITPYVGFAVNGYWEPTLPPGICG